MTFARRVRSWQNHRGAERTGCSCGAISSLAVHLEEGSSLLRLPEGLDDRILGAKDASSPGPNCLLTVELCALFCPQIWHSSDS